MVVITFLNIIVVFMAYLARDDKHKYILAWAFVLLSLVLGVRYGYGNDYFSYQYYFNHGELDEGYVKDTLEIGWDTLNKLLRPLGFPIFVFILTFIEQLLVYYLIKQFITPKYYWLATYIYVFNPYYMLVGISMMRQFLVQIIALYALNCVIKKNWIHFVILLLIGISIHKIAFLIVPLFFLPYIQTTRWWMFFGVFFAMYLVVINMNGIIEQVTIILSGNDITYADSYLNSAVLLADNKLGLKTVLHYLIFALLFIRNIKYSEEKERPFLWMVILGLFFLPFANLFPMAIRTSWIYTMAEIISIPILIKREKVTILKLFFASIFILNLLYEYVEFFKSDIYERFYKEFQTVLFV